MKDPAILFYKDKWLSATKGMRANAKGWYLNLIIFQHEFGDLPNDIEELANLCDVRFSEYTEFEQVFKQVLKQKFELNSNNRLENPFAREITKNRETYKDKRSNSGKLSYVLRYFRKNFKYKADFEDWFKNNVPLDFDIKNEQVLKQVFEQNLELYINVNVNVNNNDNVIKNKESIYEKFLNEKVEENFKEIVKKWIDYKKERKETYKSEMTLNEMYKSIKELSGNNPEKALAIIDQSIANSWKGIFELKEKSNGSKIKPMIDYNNDVYETKIKERW